MRRNILNFLTPASHTYIDNHSVQDKESIFGTDFQPTKSTHTKSTDNNASKMLKGMKNYYWYFLPFVSSLRGKKQIKRAREWMDEQESSARTHRLCVTLWTNTKKHHHSEMIVWCTIFIIGKKGESVDLKIINVRKRTAQYLGFVSINYTTFFVQNRCERLRCRKHLKGRSCMCACVCSIRRAQYILSIATIIIESMLNQDKHLLYIDIVLCLCLPVWSGHKQQQLKQKDTIEIEMMSIVWKKWDGIKKWIIFYDNLFVCCIVFFSFLQRQIQ